MANKVLRDQNGKEIGRIETVGAILVVKDMTGKIAGKYNTTTDNTYDANGKLVGRGNLLALLLK